MPDSAPIQPGLWTVSRPWPTLTHDRKPPHLRN